jgi:hypothetical protein
VAVIKGIQVCIPIARRRAYDIIESMVRLLDSRHKGRLSRGRFIERWHKLRIALFLTKEYQEFRVDVLGRNGGVCEVCNSSKAVHVHHTSPVAFYPRLALVRNRSKGVCRECHTTADREVREGLKRCATA